VPNVNIEVPKGDGKRLATGLEIVISVGLAALAVGIAVNLWLGWNVAKPRIWLYVTLAAIFLTICISAFGDYHDWVKAKRKKEYMEKIRAGDENFRMGDGK
jgi:1,4-dihydroxy-2-naphthoate octaprenyltransferase